MRIPLLLLLLCVGVSSSLRGDDGNVNKFWMVSNLAFTDKFMRLYEDSFVSLGSRFVISAPDGSKRFEIQNGPKRPIEIKSLQGHYAFSLLTKSIPVYAKNQYLPTFQTNAAIMMHVLIGEKLTKSKRHFGMPQSDYKIIDLPVPKELQIPKGGIQSGDVTKYVRGRIYMSQRWGASADENVEHAWILSLMHDYSFEWEETDPR